MLKGAYNVVDITIEKFIHAEERYYHEVSIPQTRISRDVGTIWNYYGRREFIQCRRVTIRCGVQCSLVGSTRGLREEKSKVERLGEVIRQCKRSNCRHFDVIF